MGMAPAGPSRDQAADGSRRYYRLTQRGRERQTSDVFAVRVVLLLAATCALASAEPPGIEKRIPWNDSRVVGSSDPPSPYVTKPAFERLRFDRPTVITRAPDTDRLFVGTIEGQVFSFEDRPDVASADLMLELAPTQAGRNGRSEPRQIVGLEFHPGFERNRYFYVFSRLRTPDPRRVRISRFEAAPTREGRPPKADPASELILLEYPSIGHSGGTLKFGPDGYLYIGTGDGYGQNDPTHTGQDLSDFPGSILRIDVDKTHPVRPYAIPPDNPFLNVPGARPEIYAFGFRQVWRMSFDRESGDLWAGEVGQDTWESVFRVEKGGNYGWSIQEGGQTFRPERSQGPGPILKPVIAHHHAESRSVTGGFVYRGKRLPELYGAYVYADWETGKIWALRYDGKQVEWHRELEDNALDVVAFGETHAGELYLLTHRDGRIYELHKRPPEALEQKGPAFPTLLSETGLFESVEDHRPHPALIPYSVNSPLWSDAALKERFLALPGESQIEILNDKRWSFPEGAVLVKTFSIEMREGDPSSRRRLETRLLTLQSGPEGREQWAGYTYIWNDEQTDAQLLGKDAEIRSYTIQTASGERTKEWAYPSRTDCMICHNEKAAFALGLNTWQMNRNHEYESATANQMTTLEHIGVFSGTPAITPDSLPRLIDPADESASVADRARSYLHGNCSHCHVQGGGGNADIQLLADMKLEETVTVNAKPEHGDMGTPGSLIVTPGRPERSTLWTRMATRGDGKMPHIGTLEADPSAVELIRRWIEDLGGPR